MCDCNSDLSDFDLYDIPEFPGNVRFQDGYVIEPDLDDFAKAAEQLQSETETKSEDEILSVHSKPTQATSLHCSVVDKIAHQIQGSLTHVTPFEQLRWHPDAPHEVLRPLRDTSAVLNGPARPVRAETNAQRQQRLLRRILTNPDQRKERAVALNQLQQEVVRLDFGSDKAPLQISRILKLAHEVASKTESTASELFSSSVNQARRRYQKSITRGKGSVDGIKPSRKASNLPIINSESSQGSKTAPAQGFLEPEGKLLMGNGRYIQDNFQRLHHAVNSGSTIAPPRYKAVRDHIRQLAQALGINQEIELAKFEFLYNRRSCVIVYTQARH
jgi:hypothetical protein